MYTAVIIDDEEMARVLLQEMIREYTPDIIVTETCKSLSEGVKAIRKYSPDIVFLDIEMPGHSGLELLDFFNEEEITFSIIFVTAYNLYAIQALKLSAVDYLLKPIEATALKEAVDRYEKNKIRQQYAVLKDNLAGTRPKKIGLATLNAISFVEIDNILFFEAEGAYTKVIMKEGDPLTVSRGLKNFERTLAGNPDFFRCHKSYLVNVRHITGYIKTDGGYLVVDKIHRISVAADKLETLLKKTGQHL